MAERQQRGAAFMACGAAGNVLEWYDFAVYGYFAAVIGRLFFPSADPAASLILSFSAFAVGFLSRPLGGVVFGWMGDRFGRKAVLVWSTLLMAVPSVAIGLLPTYDAIGVAAPVILVVLRLLQGVSVGGELTGSVTYMSEQAAGRRPAFTASFTVVGGVGGILLGSAVAGAVTSMLTPEQLADWGWRLPFLAGALVGIAGMLLRRHLPDDAPAESEKPSGNPIFEAMRSHTRMMFAGFLIATFVAVNFYMGFIYLTTYMNKVAGLDQATSLEINTLSMLVLIAAVVFGGWLADRVGSRQVLFLGAGLMILFAWPLVLLIDHDDAVLALAGQIGLALIVGPYNGAFAYHIGQLFPQRLRMSGFSVCYNASFALFGGTAPMMAQALVSDVGPHALAFLAIFAAFASLAGLMLAQTPQDDRQLAPAQ